MRPNKKRLRLSELLVVLWMSTFEVPLLSLTSPRIVSWKAKFQHSNLWKSCRKESRYKAYITNDFILGVVLGTLPSSFPNRWCCTAFVCIQFFTAGLIFVSPEAHIPSLCFALYHLTLALSALHLSCKLMPFIRVSNLNYIVIIGTKLKWQRNSLVHQVKFLSWFLDNIACD